MAGRAQRAHANLLENLPLFAIAVLVAFAANRFSATTALGAQLFFWGRVAHALIYIAGIVSIPLAFLLGWLGTVTSRERSDPAKYAEMEVRSLTGAGAEKAVEH